MPYKMIDVEVKVWDKWGGGLARRRFEVKTPEGEPWQELAERVAAALSLGIEHTEF